jgi:hypothetical protein
MIRNGKHDFPHSGHSIFGVFRQQFVKKSGTASRHPGDENRPLNLRIFQGSNPFAPRLDQSQSRSEQFSQMNPHQKPTQRVETRFKLETVD